MLNLFRKYGKTTVFVRLAIILAAIAVMIVFLINSGKNPEDIRPLLAANGNKLLAVRNWIQEKNLDVIRLVNKGNRYSATGVSIQVGRLYCYFDGAGKDSLMNTTSVGDISDVTDKAFELQKIADAYGAYAFIRHPNVFEVVFSNDPYRRVTGIEGTSVYHSELPPEKINIEQEIGIRNAVPWQNGWFAADASKESLYGFTIKTDSIWFFLIVIILIYMIISLIVFLLYKRQECNAEVIAKSSEYRGNRSRLQNLFDDAQVTRFDAFMIYKITFCTEKNEILEMRVTKPGYERIQENGRGELKYKSLWGRCKYIDFQQH